MSPKQSIISRPQALTSDQPRKNITVPIKSFELRWQCSLIELPLPILLKNTINHPGLQQLFQQAGLGIPFRPLPPPLLPPSQWLFNQQAVFPPNPLVDHSIRTVQEMQVWNNLLQAQEERHRGQGGVQSEHQQSRPSFQSHSRIMTTAAGWASYCDPDAKVFVPPGPFITETAALHKRREKKQLEEAMKFLRKHNSLTGQEYFMFGVECGVKLRRRLGLVEPEITERAGYPPQEVICQRETAPWSNSCDPYPTPSESYGPQNWVHNSEVDHLQSLASIATSSDLRR